MIDTLPFIKEFALPISILMIGITTMFRYFTSREKVIQAERNSLFDKLDSIQQTNLEIMKQSLVIVGNQTLAINELKMSNQELIRCIDKLKCNQ